MYNTTPNGWSPTHTCTNCPGFDSSDCCGGTGTWQNACTNGFNGWNGFGGYNGFNGFNGLNGFNGFNAFNGPFGLNSTRFGASFPWAGNGLGNATPWNATPWNATPWNATPWNATPWNFGGWNNGWNNTPNTNWSNGWNGTPNTNWSNGWNGTANAFESNLRDAFRAGYEAGLEAGFRAACTNGTNTQASCAPNTGGVNGTTRPNTASYTSTQGTRGFATGNAPTNPSQPNPSLHGPFQGNGFWNAACGTAPQGTSCPTSNPNLSGDEFAHGVKCCDERGDCGTPAYAGMKVRSVA